MRDSALWRFLRAALFPAAIVTGAGLAALGHGWLWTGVAVAVVCALLVLLLDRRPVPAMEARERPAVDGNLPPLVRAVIERLPAPVLLLDAGERVLFANESMRDVLGADPERKHMSAVLRTPQVLQAIRDTRESGFANAAAFSLPVPIERYFEAHTALMEGDLVAVLLHDLTAVRRSEQMRADFIANASHELRTPLAAVSGFIDTLRGHAKDDPAAQAEFLGIMSVEAARMRRLIEDLLSLTRIELNEHVRPEGRIMLGAIVREAAAALKPLAAQDSITVTISGGEGLPEIAGDHDELVQLFQNLVHNAIKYGREGGEVQVTLGRIEGQGGEVQVFAAVRDDGEGIPQSALPRLTERFYRVDVKRSRERGGTGLGLAIVKHIVSRHKGRLTIESRVGEGSTFTVVIPASRPDGANNGLKTALAATVTEML